MAGFLSKLFGLGNSAEASQPAAIVTYKDFVIAPAPIKEGSQFRLAGTIAKADAPTGPQHSLVRADMFSSRDEAIEFTIAKAKRLIDEQGNRLKFDD